MLIVPEYSISSLVVKVTLKLAELPAPIVAGASSVNTKPFPEIETLVLPVN
jgi:hypothetical protein